jgi:hypothetical protein
MWLRLTVGHCHIDIKDLDVHIIQSRLFKCSIHWPKQAFHRSLNAVYGHVWRFASEEVVVKLVTGKYLPILSYGTEACSLFKSVLHSLNFVINHVSMKLFETKNILMVMNVENLLELISQVVQ